MIAVVLSRIRLVRDVPYTGSRQIDLVGAVLSVVGMGGLVLGILVWQEGGEAVGLLMAIGARRDGAPRYWLVRRKREGKPTLLDPGLFRFPHFRIGISEQMLQQITLGGAMIALPIYLQMVLEYNAMEAGLSLAPLSLSMFGVALAGGRRRQGSGARATSSAPGLRSRTIGMAALIPIVPRTDSGWCARDPADDRRLGPGPAGVAAQQLHALSDLGGAGQRGRRRQLGSGLVRALVRAGVRRRDHARDPLLRLHPPGQREHGAPAGAAAADLRRRSSTTPR